MKLKLQWWGENQQKTRPMLEAPVKFLVYRTPPISQFSGNQTVCPDGPICLSRQSHRIPLCRAGRPGLRGSRERCRTCGALTAVWIGRGASLMLMANYRMGGTILCFWWATLIWILKSKSRVGTRVCAKATGSCCPIPESPSLKLAA